MTEKEYCQFAINLQNACNLSGIVLNWGRVLQECTFFQGTDNRNTHPATVLIVDKLAQLAGFTTSQSFFGDAYWYCKEQIEDIKEAA